MFTAITLTQFMTKNLIAASLFKNPKIYGINKLPKEEAKEGEVKNFG